MDSYEQAALFLGALVGSGDGVFTFQTFPDGDGESSAPPAIIHDTLAGAWPRLMDLQEYGHGIFVMVNEGDGKGRREQNVTGLRALFIDDDKLTARLSMMEEAPPNIIVTSGNGAHYYWLLAPGEPLDAFTDAQKRLAARFGTDPKVCDLARVMRLPGTQNLKDRSKPQPVELLKAKASPLYYLQETLDKLGATPIAQERPAAPSAPTPRVISSPQVDRARAYIAQMHATEGQGGNTQSLKVAYKLVQGFSLPRETGWRLFQEWNETNAHPPWSPRDLAKLWANAVKYDDGRGPVPEKVADACQGLDGGPDDPSVKAAESGDPRLDPALYCYDPTQRGRPWRHWRSGSWADGISNSDLERLLANEAGLSSRAAKAWMKKVPVVIGAKPVWNSSERIVVTSEGKVANTYRRPALQPLPEGDDYGWDEIDRIITNLVDGDEAAYDYVVGWIAKTVQRAYQGVPAKIGVALVFTGAKGAGKGVLECVMQALLGPWNVACVSQGDLDSHHQAWLAGKLCVCADEVFTAENRGAASLAKLKNLITGTRRLINPKGKDQIQIDAVENWIFFSNSHRPVEVERGDRRLAIFKTGGPIPVELGQQVADDARAGGPIVRAFLRYLLSLPAHALVPDYRPPTTAAKEEVRAASGNSAVKFAAEVKARGFWSLTASWGGSARELYVDPYPTLLNRRLMDVYRSWCAEIGAPPQQESTVLAALREELPGIVEETTDMNGRRERVVWNLPGMLPGMDATKGRSDVGGDTKVEPAQRTLAV